VTTRRGNWELERRLQTACLLIITTILCALVAYWMRAALIPFVLSFFLFQLFVPMVRVLNRKARLPHPLAVTVTLISVGTLIFWASSLISNSVGQIIESSDLYTERILSLLDQVWERYPTQEERFKALTRQEIAKFGEGVGSFLAAMTNSVVYLISQSTAVLLFLMFLLFGSRTEQELTGVLAVIDQKVKNYIQVKTALSLSTGFVVGTILYLIGVDLAFVFGLMAVLLNYIPNVGSILATALPIPVLLVDPTISSAEAVLAVVLTGSIQFLVGNMLEPKLLGDSLDLSPVVILFSLTVWTSLWGGVGALLAVPITSVIQILCDQLEFTKPVGAFLRGDLLGFLGAYKKQSSNEHQVHNRRSKAIPAELEEVAIDKIAHSLKKPEKRPYSS